MDSMPIFQCENACRRGPQQVCFQQQCAAMLFLREETSEVGRSCSPQNAADADPNSNAVSDHVKSN